MGKAGLDRPIEDEDGPTRTCAATRTARPLDELVRFALSPDGVVTPDLRQRLPGRGVWVTARRAAIADAGRKKAFARGFKAPANAPEDLPELVERLLARDALAALSFANKAGATTAGLAKVEAEVGSGRAVALLQACDGGADGAKKLRQAARRAGREEIEPIDLFTCDELSVALGRENVIHAALARGGATENFLARCRRLRFYRADDEPTRGASATPDGLPSSEAARDAGPETSAAEPSGAHDDGHRVGRADANDEFETPEGSGALAEMDGRSPRTENG